MAKIITVYVNRPREADCDAAAWVPTDMSYIRWFKISQALAQHGHEVDIALPDGTAHWPIDPVLLGDEQVGRVPLSGVRWSGYDVVKTLFNRGIDTLSHFGGDKHPFIISKLGSMVGPEDRPGIHFYGDVRKEMFAAQCKINSRARYVALLSQSAADLWVECHGSRTDVLLVPGGVDAIIPSAGGDPFPDDGRGRCLFAGHIYTAQSQPEANAVLCTKLNELGRLLNTNGLGMFMMGSGDTSALDRNHVTYLGAVPYTQTWRYLLHADVGIVVSAGAFMHNNESSKIYHYLRAGLPIVAESGFPNVHLVGEAGLGYVCPNGDLPHMAQQIARAAKRDWDIDRAVRFALDGHTWFQRAQVYDEVISAECARHG